MEWPAASFISTRTVSPKRSDWTCGSGADQAMIVPASSGYGPAACAIDLFLHVDYEFFG